MKIAIATNAYKGSLSAVDAAQAVAAGLKNSRLNCEIVTLPLADGGDGTLEVMLSQPGSQRYTATVRNPLGESVQAAYGILADGETAVVEMALASGLALIADRRDAMRASTFGTGELMQHALAQGAKRIILGVGGSATVDGGAGCLQALGVRLLDRNGQPLAPGGGSLEQLTRVEPNPILRETEILILCDVDNPPLGANGAAAIFGPQKGASPAQVESLEKNLRHFFTVIADQTGHDVRALKGGGAAGAIAAGLAALAGAKLVPGAQTLLHFLGYAEKLQGCNLVITGEGQIDDQTMHGKAPAMIAQQAGALDIPTIAIGGTIPTQAAALENSQISAAFTLVPGPVPLSEAMHNTAAWLENIARQIGNLLAVGTKMKR